MPQCCLPYTCLGGRWCFTPSGHDSRPMRKVQPWWSASLEQPSAPTCSSGRLPKRSRTCSASRGLRHLCATRAQQARNSAASGGIPGAACSIPTSLPGSIILATAVTLNVAGVRNIETAAMLFALGILGVGLIGVPVLAGSAGYALAEAMGWKWGLGRRATDARGFYGVIAVSVLAGLVIQYSPISPMKALFWSAVINGVVAVPLMVVIIVLVSRKSVMEAS